MKITAFLDNLMESYYVGGTCYLHLQGRKIKSPEKEAAGSKD
jgi:hypothetical protein